MSATSCGVQRPRSSSEQTSSVVLITFLMWSLGVSVTPVLYTVESNKPGIAWIWGIAAFMLVQTVVVMLQETLGPTFMLPGRVRSFTPPPMHPRAEVHVPARRPAEHDRDIQLPPPSAPAGS